MSTHNLCFEQKYEKYQNFYLKTQFLVVKFSIYLDRRVFVMIPVQCIIRSFYNYTIAAVRELFRLIFFLISL